MYNVYNIYWYTYLCYYIVHKTQRVLIFFSLWEYLCYGGKEWVHYFSRGHVNLQFCRHGVQKTRGIFSQGIKSKYPLWILFNSIYMYYIILLSIQATADVLKTAFLTSQLLLVVHACVRACASTILVGRCTIQRKYICRLL